MRKSQQNKKLVIFGTLFKSKMGGIKDLLVLLGKGKEARKLDSEYQRRKIFGPWGLKELASLYKGFSEEKLRQVALDYCQKNLLEGIREASIELKKKGHLIGVISPNPQFLLDALKEILPLDFAIGSQLEFKNGIATGKIKREINRYTRAKILERKQKELGVKKQNVITIARSSITHLPLAKASGVFIGFDPEREDIRKIVPTIPTNDSSKKIFFGN